jgi:PII-like signaling protein
VSELLKLTAHFGERDRVGGGLLADAMLDSFAQQGIHTSVLIRGIAGFGLRHHLRTDRLLTLSEDLPVVATAIDDRARIEAVLASLPGPRRSGLLAVDPLTENVAADEGDLKLTVYLRRRQRGNGVPAFVAACEILRRHGVGGATAILGVDGTLEGARRRGRFFSANSDVPMLVIAVGAGERIGAALVELDRVLAPSLRTLEPARVCKRDGKRLASLGPAAWQRLTAYTSESATVGGRAVHHELIRRLRRSGALGATAVRGIWGFHGEHRPHGDRFLQVRRRAPILTTVVDEAERIAAALEIADELTPERGMLTCEPVGVVPQPAAS